MISIQAENGELVKVLGNIADGEFGFHRSFGFISKKNAMARVNTRKRQFYDYTNNDWLCSFKINKDKNNINFESVSDCQIKKENNLWQLSTSLGNFNILAGATPTSGALPIPAEKTDEDKGRTSILLMAAILGGLMIWPLLFVENIEEEKPEEKILEPITVQIRKQTKTVKIQQSANLDIKVKPSIKSPVTKRAIQRNLGFLGMVGSKDLSKVTGGVPQKLKQATAGAGAGGDAGSGGEVLTGLGKGLKKTTVGNTGMKGLGGIGTKGAGGGAGGYGNTRVASGSGKGISAIAVSSSDMVLEGGISRYAINATIAKYLNQVRRCYEKELKNDASLQGIVEMSFQINARGRLNYSNVNKSTLKSPPVEKCISTKMMGWQFPRPKGGVNVNVKYPFMLRPVGS